MTKALTKVVYKPDSQSTDEFIAIVNPEEVRIQLMSVIVPSTDCSLHL